MIGGTPQLISLFQLQHTLAEATAITSYCSISGIIYLCFLIFRGSLLAVCEWCQFILSEMSSLNCRVAFIQPQDIYKMIPIYTFWSVALELSCCVCWNRRERQRFVGCEAYSWHVGLPSYGFRTS